MPAADEVTRTEQVGRDRTTASLPSPPRAASGGPTSNDEADGSDDDSITRVTVLLVIVPGPSGFGHPRPTADPILCVGDTCFISRGAGETAVSMPRNRAFGTGNTIGGRAGACNNQTACVFRNVDLKRHDSEIQPIDMRFWRHDRREPRRVKPDRSCALGAEGLVCQKTAIASDYRAWVVPEGVAERVGADRLKAALEGLARDK
jgi:colicin import membrane protein